MNYYEARQIKSDDGSESGIWHFTCRNDGRIWPVGCTRDCQHASPEDAERHYWEWSMDQPIHRSKWEPWSECAGGCGHRTPHAIRLGDMNGPESSICEECGPDDDAIRRIVREAHPFSPGIRIYSSW